MLGVKILLFFFTQSWSYIPLLILINIPFYQTIDLSVDLSAASAAEDDFWTVIFIGLIYGALSKIFMVFL
jgi:hypothetical protein